MTARTAGEAKLGVTDTGTVHGYALAPGAGRILSVLGAEFTVKAAAPHTTAAFAVTEVRLPTGFCLVSHQHAAEDEALYVLEGRVAVACGDRAWHAGVGSFVLLPKGIPHALRVDGAYAARVLVIWAPAGLEEFVAEAAHATDRRLDAEPTTSEHERLATVAAKYGLSLTEPSTEGQ